MRRLAIADFAHQHHVRVLAQNSAQPAGKGHIDFRVNLGLTDALQLIFDGVFNGHDVAFPRVEAAQRGVEGGAFSRTGRPGHQHDAVRAGDQPIYLLQQGGSHPEGQQVEIDAIFIEQTQHHALAVARRQGGDAHVDGASANAQRHAPILRNALFGDIQARHHLNARDQQRGEAALGAQDFAQDAVDAKANLQVALIGFDMNIRGFLFDGLGKHGVNQANNRRVVFAVQ